MSERRNDRWNRDTEALQVFVESHTRSPILDLPESNEKVATGFDQSLNVLLLP